MINVRKRKKRKEKERKMMDEWVKDKKGEKIDERKRI